MRVLSRVVGVIIIAALAYVTPVAQRGTQTSSPPPPTRLSAGAAQLVLAVDRLLAARWYPPSTEIAIGGDEAILTAALGSSGLTKQLAIRALGRFENAARVRQISPFLSDPNEIIRAETVRALRRAMRSTRDLRPAQIESLLWGNLQAPGADSPAGLRIAADLDAFEQVALRDPSRPIDARTRDALIRLARNGFDLRSSDPSPVALRILATLHIPDAFAANKAVAYRCPSPSPETCGWDIRLSGVQLLDPRDPANDSAFATALDDPAAPVRIEALHRRASVIEETKRCNVFVDALHDKFLVVRQEAVDLVTPSCEEREAITTDLKLMAVDYGDATHPLERASLAAHALIALARFDPDEAKADMDKVGANNAGWEGLFQVRAAAALLAGVLKDEKTARRFMADPNANVRVEALRSLSLLRSQELIPQAYLALDSVGLTAIRAGNVLERDDMMLIRTGAAILRAETDRQKLSNALLRTLARLTAAGKDTSREARVEIFARLKELATFDPGGPNPLVGEHKTLESYLKDFDPMIAEAAADTLAILDNGKRPIPQPTRRIQQPTEQELQNLPRTAIITLGKPGDTLVWSLLGLEAPLSVARFVSLAQRGYYNGQMFYRLVPLSFLAGGSPGANEFSGDERFLRDEVGSIKHDLGTVSMTNHGRDTGNAQFFIDLVRNPEWDDEYTVFAQVTGCTKGFIDVPLVNCLSELLEGTKITRVEIK